MLLAPLVLAAALGQCPEPPSRFGPPPCAADNVPGCVPGYVRDVDRWGRVIFRCDPSYGAQAPAFAPPPRPYAPAPPQAYAQGPAPQPAPAPAPGPAPQFQPGYPQPLAAPAPRERRGQLGLVLMPGGTTYDRNHTNETTGAVGLELRGPFGGARLRGLFEYAQHSRVWDVALKYSFNDRGEIRPFLAVGVGGANLDRIAGADPGWRPTGAVSAGVDLYFARDLFITLEAKQRAFTRDTPDGWRGSALHQTSVFAGVGIYL